MEANVAECIVNSHGRDLWGLHQLRIFQGITHKCNWQRDKDIFVPLEISQPGFTHPSQSYIHATTP